MESGTLEVTQVIQDRDNGVSMGEGDGSQLPLELVAGKRTVVRVFVQGPGRRDVRRYRGRFGW